MIDVTSEDQGSSKIIRFANSNRGYLTAQACDELRAAIEEAIDEDGIRSAIITGQDDVFVRHYDVSEIVNAAEAVAAGFIDKSAFEAGPFANLVKAIADSPKPVIAAINGTCMGGGFELALACDFRIAQANVEQIGLPESRIGIFPGGGGTQRLPRLIGEARALEFIMLGQVVAAAEAKELGLVNAVSPDAIASALELAERIAALSPEAVAFIKRLTRDALGRPMADGLRAEQHGFYEVLKTDGAAQGMRSFFENGEDITLWPET